MILHKMSQTLSQNQKAWLEAQDKEVTKDEHREWAKRHYEKRKMLKEFDNKDNILPVQIPFVSNTEEENI